MFEFTSFFIILLTALVFSKVFGRFHVPWIIALIIGGIIIGPNGLKIIDIDSTLGFFKNLGIVFLMFMAGLHVQFSGMKTVWKESFFIATLSGFFSFFTGVGLGFFIGYDIEVSILIGIIFISSSIAVLIPFLEKRGLLHSRIGKTAVSAIMIQDIVSLIFLAIILQYFFSSTPLPLPLFVLILFIIIFAVGIIKVGIPHLRRVLAHPEEKEKDVFEKDLRLVFVVLLGMVLISEILGLHSIIGAFFAGIILSEAISGTTLKEKIHVLAYGLFIPIFFVVVGAQTDLTIFLKKGDGFILLFLVIFTSIVSKFVGGWISSRLIGFRNTQSAFLGSVGIPQLSTTLAVVAVSQQMGILEESLVTAFVSLSIITTFVGPFLSGYIFKKIKEEGVMRDFKIYFTPEIARKLAEQEQNENNYKVSEIIDMIVLDQLKERENPLYIADLGAGAHPDRYHNLFKRLLKDPKGNIDWVDVSKNMLDLAKEYISNENYREREQVISFVNKEITDYLDGAENDKLDAIIMKDVINQIEDLNEIFALISLKVKENGKVIATIDTNPELKSYSKNVKHLYRGTEFPENDIKKLKDGDNFSIKFLKRPGEPSAGCIEGAEIVNFYHSAEKIKNLGSMYGFNIFIGKWEEFLFTDNKKKIIDIDQEILVMTKKIKAS